MRVCVSCVCWLLRTVVAGFLFYAQVFWILKEIFVLYVHFATSAGTAAASSDSIHCCVHCYINVSIPSMCSRRIKKKLHRRLTPDTSLSSSFSTAIGSLCIQHYTYVAIACRRCSCWWWRRGWLCECVCVCGGTAMNLNSIAFNVRWRFLFG